ncbi:MAG TPA: hypothetical protein VGH67_06160 [Solirubrobacteraceae bacterium]
MIRQRVNLRTPALAYLVRILTVVLGLALVWYGLMLALLAAKVAPHTVNAISGYRSVYHDAATLSAHDFTTLVRWIAGVAGFLAFLLFAYLAVQELPRPYLARGEVPLTEEETGTTVVRPRAIERVAELAARGHSEVASAAGRLGDGELNVAVGLRRAGTAPTALRDIRTRVRAELDRHELPALPVNVTLTDYDSNRRRELA